MADLEKLGKVIQNLELQADGLVEFNQIYAEIGSVKESISESLELMKDNNSNQQSISKEVQTKLENSEKQIEKLEESLIKKIDELYQDNKSFQKELDASLVTRLDKNKSDIQVEVRNEGTQIQRAFETSLTSNFSSMESKLKTNYSEQEKQIKMLKTLLIVSMALSLGTLIGVFLK